MTAPSTRSARGRAPRRSLSAWWGGHAWLQVAFVSLAGAIVAGLALDVMGAMRRLGLSPGFGFLARPANFAIGEGLVPYAAGDSYLRALLVGLGNTIEVAALGCLLATVLGVALGLARLSGNLLLSWLVQAYVEAIRNTPLLLQLFFWSATLHALPGPRQALQPLPGLFLTNRGIAFPWPVFAGGVPALSAPVLHGFNLAGGASVSPELAALLIGLVVNAAATTAEIVRSGIQSIPSGQWEAAHALGLRRGRTLRLVVMPQAMRVITPLMTSAYLDLTKNSSLAVAIGFPDLVSVLNTTANQTGQSLEAMTILVAAYLALNLAVSAAMNRRHSRSRSYGSAS